MHKIIDTDVQWLEERVAAGGGGGIHSGEKSERERTRDKHRDKT